MMHKVCFDFRQCSAFSLRQAEVEEDHAHSRETAVEKEDAVPIQQGFDVQEGKCGEERACVEVTGGDTASCSATSGSQKS